MSLENLIFGVLLVGPPLPLRFHVVLPKVNLRYAGCHRVRFEVSDPLTSMV